MKNDLFHRGHTTMLARTCGGLLCLMAVTVMAGWHAQSERIVRIGLTFEPMKFNTAVCFLLCGLALAFNRKSWAFILNACVCLVAALTLSEYIFHINIGIDTLFMEPFTQKRSPYPGRFAPNTAVAFILTGFSFMCLAVSWGRFHKYRGFAVAFTGSLVVALGAAPLLGYITGTQDAYVWGLMVGMALHTALSFVGLGLCILLLSWRQMEGPSLWFSVPVFVMLFAVTLSLWQSMRNENLLTLDRMTTAQADAVSSLTKNRLDELYGALQRMDGRWEIAGGTPEKEWMPDAMAYVRAYPVLRGIAWADKDTNVRWLATIRKNVHRIPGFRLASEERRRIAIERAKATRLPQMTDIVDLTSGGKGYVYLSPLYVGDRYDGLIAAGFDVDELFSTIFGQSDLFRNFNLAVYQDDTLIYRSGDTHSGNEAIHGQAEASIAGQVWRFHLSPTQAFIDANRSRLPGITMGIGLVISLLSALSVWLAIEALHNTKLTRRSRDQIAYFVKHIPAAVAICDCKMRYIMVSDRWYQDFRLRDPDIVGKSHYEVFHKMPDKLRLILESCLAYGSSSHGEDSVELKSGRVMWMRWDVRPWHDASGAVSGLIMATEIITARKEAEQALKEARAEADRANAAKGDFLANMSHEIRTPMNGIIGMTHLLRNTSLDPRQQHYAETISHSAEALLQIINDILDFSKIEAGRMELEHIPFDLRLLCEEVSEIMALRAQEKNVEFFLRYHHGCPLRIVGDPGRIRQILFNLCSNAVKFTEKGHVLLDVAAPAPEEGRARLRVTVSDTGIGIPESRQADLFGKFTQADASTTRKYGGTGLGLAISKQLVEMMGGEIALESRLGEGTAISFWIEAAAAPGDADPVGVSSSLAGLRALVVDDNRISRDILHDVLTEAGMVVAMEEKPRNALDLLKMPADRTHDYDILILDHTMPGLSGLDVARAVRDMPHRRDIRIILATSQPTRSDSEEIAKARINGYLTKPLRPSELLAMIATLDDARRNGTDAGLMTRFSLGQNDAGQMNVAGDVRFDGAVALVAEDNPVNQEVLQSMLRSMGVQSVIAANGREAVQRVKADRFDIVFMDCQMPVLDGFEATRILRPGTSVPIVALTANVMKGDREKCLESGMNDYLSKPVMEKDLAAVLRKWLPARPSPQGGGEKDASAPIPTETGAALDPATIGRMKAILKDRYPQVIETFRQNAARLMDEMEAAAGRGDPGAVARAAHSLKSSGGQLGARRLQSLMDRMERDGADMERRELEAALGEARAALDAALRGLDETI